MSTASVPSSNLWVPDGVPARWLSVSTSGTNITLQYGMTSGYPAGGIVLGCDFVASGAQPVQCFVELQVPTGVQVYYDSQSTGEGLGVRFPWRGQIPLVVGEKLTVSLQSSANINWYATVWGIATPYPPMIGTAQ